MIQNINYDIIDGILWSRIFCHFSEPPLSNCVGVPLIKLTVLLALRGEEGFESGATLTGGIKMENSVQYMMLPDEIERDPLPLQGGVCSKKVPILKK